MTSHRAKILTDSFDIIDCSSVATADLWCALNSSFSDYVVPLQLDAEQFAFFCAQRDFSAKQSFVAKDPDGQIAALWLATAPRPDLSGRCYSLATGTVPAFRRKGLLKRLFAEVSAHARSCGATGFQHEVITTNAAAVAAYRDLGFADVREVAIWSVPRSGLADKSRHVREEISIRSMAPQDIPDTASWFEAMPTPQNSRRAVINVPYGALAYGAYRFGRLAGWGAVFANGAIAQIAVDPECRRQGVGSALLAELALSVSGKELTAINVDIKAITTNGFLRSLGAEEVLRQNDMVLTL